jgi:hypothetical protein
MLSKVEREIELKKCEDEEFYKNFSLVILTY